MSSSTHIELSTVPVAQHTSEVENREGTGNLRGRNFTTARQETIRKAWVRISGTIHFMLYAATGTFLIYLGIGNLVDCGKENACQNTDVGLSGAYILMGLVQFKSAIVSALQVLATCGQRAQENPRPRVNVV